MCLLALAVGVAACAVSPAQKKRSTGAKPPIAEKQAPAADAGDFFAALLEARMQLLSHEQAAATKAIQEAGLLLPASGRRGQDASRIFAEVAFSKLGTPGVFYVPLKKGAARYDALEDALSEAREQELMLRGFRLVTMGRAPAKNLVKNKLTLAAQALEQNQHAADPGYGISTAERLIQEIYKASRPAAYKSSNSRAVAAHSLQAALALHRGGNDALSRDALKEAKAALSTLGGNYLSAEKPAHLREMDHTAKRLEQALKTSTRLPRADIEKALKMEYVNPNTEE